jgi:hypothetical protein
VAVVADFEVASIVQKSNFHLNRLGLGKGGKKRNERKKSAVVACWKEEEEEEDDGE